MSLNDMEPCRYCFNPRPLKEGDCPHCGSPLLPADYEPCGDCGFDHGYEYEHAYAAHYTIPKGSSLP